MLTITPFLWFDTQAEEAMNFYASIFPDTKVLSVQRAGDQVMSVSFELQGQKFMGLNAGPLYTFNEAVSFYVPCETQKEIDELWAKLTAGGGEPGRCGWLKDKFGLSWQIIPNVLGSLLGHPDRVKAGRATQAMLQMNKLDIAGLQSAFDGK
jgi:predicted 3-demethylubiquinone-9 3-methyltransferase (glyoxalase superfamily)